MADKKPKPYVANLVLKSDLYNLNSITTEATLENKFQICLTKLNSFETRGIALNDIKTLIALNKNNQKILRHYISSLKINQKNQNISNIAKEAQAMIPGILAQEYKNNLYDPLDKPPNLIKTIERLLTQLKDGYLLSNNQIQNAVAERNNTTKKLSVEEILNQDAWVDGLTVFAEQNNLKDDSNRTVFSSVSADAWLSKLLHADPKTICAFRSWFHRFYPTNIIWQTKPVDVDTLDVISEKIDPSKSDDLIVKSLLGWLKRDIKKYCALYVANEQNAVSNEDENNG